MKRKSTLAACIVLAVDTLVGYLYSQTIFGCETHILSETANDYGTTVVVYEYACGLNPELITNVAYVESVDKWWSKARYINLYRVSGSAEINAAWDGYETLRITDTTGFDVWLKTTVFRGIQIQY